MQRWAPRSWPKALGETPGFGRPEGLRRLAQATAVAPTGARRPSRSWSRRRPNPCASRLARAGGVARVPAPRSGPEAKWPPGGAGAAARPPATVGGTAALHRPAWPLPQTVSPASLRARLRGIALPRLHRRCLRRPRPGLCGRAVGSAGASGRRRRRAEGSAIAAAAEVSAAARSVLP